MKILLSKKFWNVLFLLLQPFRYPYLHVYDNSELNFFWNAQLTRAGTHLRPPRKAKWSRQCLRIRAAELQPRESTLFSHSHFSKIVCSKFRWKIFKTDGEERVSRGSYSYLKIPIPFPSRITEFLFVRVIATSSRASAKVFYLHRTHIIYYLEGNTTRKGQDTRKKGLKMKFTQ